MSAKRRLLECFKNNVAKLIDRDTLSSVAKAHDWQRVIRTLRDEGWQIESSHAGYTLKTLEKLESNKKRTPINARLRYAVLHRDNSTCQRCGKTPEDGVKLEVDHKLPVNWGGTSDLDNLWMLCVECKQGKEEFYADFKVGVMAEVSIQKSGYRKIEKFFELTPNEIIPPNVLSMISGIRDWERAIRYIRSKKGIHISWVPPSTKYPNGGYLFKPIK